MRHEDATQFIRDISNRVVVIEQEFNKDRDPRWVLSHKRAKHVRASSLFVANGTVSSTLVCQLLSGLVEQHPCLWSGAFSYSPMPGKLPIAREAALVLMPVSMPVVMGQGLRRRS